MDSLDGVWVQLSAFSTFVVAFATVMLAVANWVMIRRERRRREERLRAIDAKVRAASFQIIGELWHWKELDWPIEGPTGARIAFAREIQRWFPKVEHLAKEMVEDAPEASPELSEVARAVFAKVSTTTSDLRHLASYESPDDLSRHGRVIADSLGTYRSLIGECEDLLEEPARAVADRL